MNCYRILTRMLVVLITGFNFSCSTEVSERPATASFSFALIGDIPRIGDKAIEPDLAPFLRLRDEINSADVKFVIHDGDFKSGGSPCSDENFNRWYNLVNTFEAPFFFGYGDNEWTDCHSKNAGGYDPLERLEKLRELFHPASESLGKNKLKMERQSDNPGDPRFKKYVENFRWIYGTIMFVGLNVQGSNNNLGRTPEMDREFIERDDAVIAFMRESFALAKKNGSPGIVITIQANPQFDRRKDDPRPDGYKKFRSVLEEETLGFGGKPVILVHGDSHYFRIDKPMKASTSGRRIENFTRVETFGAPDVHWILATVDYNDPNLFRFEQRIVKGNLINHLQK